MDVGSTSLLCNSLESDNYFFVHINIRYVFKTHYIMSVWISVVAHTVVLNW